MFCFSCSSIFALFALADADEVSEESMAAFVASWDAGQLETKEFNLPAREEGQEGMDEDTE